jgi:hypothetical protein
MIMTIWVNKQTGEFTDVKEITHLNDEKKTPYLVVHSFDCKYEIESKTCISRKVTLWSDFYEKYHEYNKKTKLKLNEFLSKTDWHDIQYLDLVERVKILAFDTHNSKTMDVAITRSLKDLSDRLTKLEAKKCQRLKAR